MKITNRERTNIILAAHRVTDDLETALQVEMAPLSEAAETTAAWDRAEAAMNILCLHRGLTSRLSRAIVREVQQKLVEVGVYVPAKGRTPPAFSRHGVRYAAPVHWHEWLNITHEAGQKQDRCNADGTPPEGDLAQQAANPQA